MPFHDEFVVHYKTLFCVVLAIGVGQIILALYGGYLSAIPLDLQQRRRHYWRLSCLGLFLFLFTIVLGYLNDKTQNDSQMEANHAKRDLKNVRDELDSVYLKENGVFISINELRQEVKSHTPGQTPLDPRIIVRKLDSLQQQVTSALPARVREAFPSNPRLSPPASGSSAVVNQNQTVTEQVREVSAQVESLDGQWQHGLLGIGQAYTGPYKMGGAPPMPRTLSQQFLDRFVSEEKTSTSEYLRILPTIEQARHKAMASLGKTSTEAAKDQKEFEAANKLASSSPPVPNTIDNLYASQFRFHPMADYLQSIERELEALPRH